MLQVKTKVKEAFRNNQSIGFGLFADQFIPKGTIIWKLNPLIDKIINVDQLVNFSELELKYINTYCYRENTVMILCADDGKYYNHSVNCNCDDLIDDVLGSITVAKVDINEGEELTSDYRTFDDDSKNGELDGYL